MTESNLRFSSKPWRRQPFEPRTTISVAISIVILLIVFWILSCMISEHRREALDDSFITYIYARNLSEGYGIRYNSTDLEHTDGSSSPLHVSLLALAFLLELDPLAATRGLSLMFFLTVPIAFGFVIARVGALPIGIGLLAAASVFLGLSFLEETAMHSWAGMETIMFLSIHAWVFSWAVACACDRSRAPSLKLALLGIIVMTLLVVCRPEGLVLSLFYIAAVALVRVRRARTTDVIEGVQPILAILLGFAGVVGLILIWKWMYFGYVLNNAYFVKSSNAIFGSSGAVFPGIGKVNEFLLKRYVPLAIVTLCVAMVSRPGLDIWNAVALLLPSLAMVALYSRAIHEVSPGFRFEYPFLIPVVGCLAFCTGRVWARYKAGFRALITIGVVSAPLLGMHQRPELSHLISAWIRSPVSSATRWIDYTHPIGSQHPLAKLGVDLRETGLEREASILLSGGGMVPYYSKFKTIDWIGLNNNYLSGRNARSLSEVWEYIESQRPDVVYSVLPPATPGVHVREEDPAFKSRPVEESLKGRGCTLWRYWNVDLLGEMFYREMCFVRDHYRFGSCYQLGPDWALLAYVRKDSPHVERILSVLSESKMAKCDEGVMALYVNDPRNLGQDQKSGWRDDGQLGEVASQASTERPINQ